MRDYEELVKALRICGNRDSDCKGCPLRGKYGFNDCAFAVDVNAADAIEELVAAVPKWISMETLPEEYNTPFREKAGLAPCSDPVIITLLDIDVFEGKKAPYEGDRVVVVDRFSGGVPIGNKILVSAKSRAIAWMPLPNPFVDGGDRNGDV